jgi:hypothetical protein
VWREVVLLRPSGTTHPLDCICAPRYGPRAAVTQHLLRAWTGVAAVMADAQAAAAGAGEPRDEDDEPLPLPPWVNQPSWRDGANIPALRRALLAELCVCRCARARAARASTMFGWG